MALLLMATGREGDAERYWKVVAAADGSQRLALADYYVATNRPRDADRELSRLVASSRDDEAAGLRLALVRYALGDAEAAFASLDQLLALKPSVPARILRAQLLASSGRAAEALAEARALTAANPTSAHAHVVEGDLLNAEGNAEAAIKAFEAAMRQSRGDPIPYLRIANLYLAQGRPADAIAVAERARGAAGNTPAIALVTIEALTRVGQIERAEQETRTSIAAWPRVPVFHARLGAIALGGNRPDEARRAFEAMLKLTPHAVEGVAGLVVLDLRDRRPREARKRIDAALRARPLEPKLQLLSAQISAAVGDRAEAEATLKRLVAGNPADLDAFNALGALYLRDGRLAAAREQFTIAEKSARTPGAATMVGLILEAEGKRDAARDLYQQTLTRFPRAAIAANNLAWIYLAEGRLDDALKWATVAHEELPRRAEVADTLGSIYLRRGENARALQWLASAADLGPDNPTYRYHLATAYMRTGQAAAAAGELGRAIESHTAFIGREDAVRLLAQLNGNQVVSNKPSPVGTSKN
jgi:tetratricopeptide (TPR) repeat protein